MGRREVAAIGLIVGLVIAACGGEGSSATGVTTPSGKAAVLRVVAGDSQTATAGKTLALPIRLLVTDSSGRPVANQEVRFYPSQGTATPAAALSDGDGIASTTWTPGTQVGHPYLVARIGDPRDDPKIIIGNSIVQTAAVATVVAAAPAQVAIVRGNAQVAAVGAKVVVPPTVRVSDEYGNVLTGVPVTFVARNGGATSTSTVTTTYVIASKDVLASVDWTLGPSQGADTLIASIASGASAVFTASAFPRFLATDVAPGADRLCALDLSGAAWCWGTTYGTTPVPVATSLRFTSLAHGQAYTHLCGLTSAGAAYCWGNNVAGQLGDGTVDERALPTPVSGSLRFTQLVTTYKGTCGLTADGIVYCWGLNDYGQVGDGSTVDRRTPVPVATSQRFLRIAGGFDHACGVAVDSTAYCWGATGAGEAGVRPGTASACRTSGTNDCVLVPTLAYGDTRRYASIVAGFGSTCGITSAGFIYCWGRGEQYLIGTPPRPQPIIQTSPYTSVVESASTLCGLNPDARAWCIGGNAYGELGRGATPGSGTADRPIELSERVSGLFAGHARICAIAVNGELYCWGQGPVGDGSTSDQPLPRAVVRVP